MDFALSDNQKNIIATFREFGESVFTLNRYSSGEKIQGLPDEVVKGFVDRLLRTGRSKPRRHGHYVADTYPGRTLPLCRCRPPIPKRPVQSADHGRFADETASRVLDDYRQTGRLMFSLGVSEPNAGSDTMRHDHIGSNARWSFGAQRQENLCEQRQYSPSILCAAIDKDTPSEDSIRRFLFGYSARFTRHSRRTHQQKIGQSMVPFASVSFRRG